MDNIAPDAAFATRDLQRAENGLHEPILALLKTGTELDAVDAHGATALHEAVARREPDIYALLVQAGANPDLADAGGTTPAMLFEDVYGMTYEEKFRDRIIDADYFRIRKQANPEQGNEDHAFAPSGSTSHPVPPLQHAVHHSDSAGIEPVLARRCLRETVHQTLTRCRCARLHGPASGRV